MSGGLAITLAFGGEDRVFRLGIGEWRKIQVKCDAGPEELAARLAPSVTAQEGGIGLLSALGMGLAGRWRIDDVREVILQGLLGGDEKLDAITATRLVQDYVDDRPLASHAPLAFAIVMASLQGVPDEAHKPGELSGEAAEPTLSPGESSGSATSTGAAREPGSPPPS